VARSTKPIVLDPKNEFEAVLIEIVEMHRKKAALYGSTDDEHWNFYEAANRLGITPIDACDAFTAKHEAAWKRWKMGDRERTAGSDDASIDLSVYGVIRRVLYKRGAF